MSGRQPRRHVLEAADGRWRCCCTGVTFDDPAAGRRHVAGAAREALRRLDDARAWATMSVSTWRSEQRQALNLLNPAAWSTRLRPYYRPPTYDGYGSLQVELDWGRLAEDVNAERLVEDPQRPTDFLLLRIALSTVGLHRMNLAELAGLGGDDPYSQRGRTLLMLLTGRD
jgi:hypothetical protein